MSRIATAYKSRIQIYTYDNVEDITNPVDFLYSIMEYGQFKYIGKSE